MFARNVSLRLKPNSLTEFTRTMNEQIIPLLRKQKGFQDEITFSTPDGTNVTAISLWDSQENADAYGANANGYQGVLNALEKVLDGTPRVRTSNVTNSTFQKSAAPALDVPVAIPVVTAQAVN